MAGSGSAVPSDLVADFRANADVLDKVVNSPSFEVTGRETPSNPSGKPIKTLAWLMAQSPEAVKHVTDGYALEANKIYTLGSGSYTLPAVANTGDCVWLSKVDDSYDPVITPSGTGSFRFPDNTKDNELIYDTTDIVRITWSGSKWEVLSG